jgi:hypothetical protein
MTGTLKELNLSIGDKVSYVSNIYTIKQFGGRLYAVRDNSPQYTQRVDDSTEPRWCLISRAEPNPVVHWEGHDFDLSSPHQPMLGMLPDPAQEVLRSWKHGCQYWCPAFGEWVDASEPSWNPGRAYRVKLPPKRVNCYRGISATGQQQSGTCALGPDGQPDWTTFEVN